MTTRSASDSRVLGVALTGALVVAACSSDAPSSRAATRASPEEAEAPQTPASPDAERTTIPGAPRPGAPQTEPGPKEGGPAEPVPDLYDPDTIPKFELTLDAAAIAILSDPAEAEKKTWVHGTFKLGAITFVDVGVRRKGSNTYRVLPQKAGLKVKFNKWVKGQKLYGLEELTLNNMVFDATKLAERLTYHVFRAAGLPAPKANTAALTINGEDYGIYANVETPDENFLARAFGGKAKTLYEVSSAGATWLPTATVGFAIDVPFPGAPAGTKPDLDRLLQAVATASDTTLLANVEPYLHTQQWLRFSAAEAVTAHPDGYAYGVVGYSHNYFMSGDSDGKFSLTPWSVDLCLSDNDPVDAASPPGNTVFARCRNSMTCWDAYKAEMRSLLAVYETMDLGTLAKKWHDQIDALVRSDPKRETTISSYEWEMANLYPWLAARPAVVRAQLGL